MPEKMSKEERKAAGWFFGLSNLGWSPCNRDGSGGEQYFHHPFKHPYCLIQEHGPNCWDKMFHSYHHFIEQVAESDEMYNGMLEEIDHWIETMINDYYFIDRWNKMKAGEDR